MRLPGPVEHRRRAAAGQGLPGTLRWLHQPEGWTTAQCRLSLDEVLSGTRCSKARVNGRLQLNVTDILFARGRFQLEPSSRGFRFLWWEFEAGRSGHHDRGLRAQTDLGVTVSIRHTRAKSTMARNSANPFKTDNFSLRHVGGLFAVSSCAWEVSPGAPSPSALP